MWYTETHTRIDKWGRATKGWAQNVESTKTLVLHNSRETLAQLLNRRIRHLCTTYKMQNVWAFYPKYAMCRMFRWYDPRWLDMTILYAMWYDAMALAYKLLSSSLLLKSLFFFYMATMRNAQTKIAIVYMREQSCDTRYDMMIPIWYGMYAMGAMITNVHK